MRSAGSESYSAVDRGEHVDPSKLTVAALVSERIALWRSAGKISAKTAERREQLAKGQIARIGSIQIQKLTTDAVEAWHADLLAGGLAPQTIRDAHVLLARSLDDAVKHRMVVRNVARLQKPPRMQRKKVQIIPADAIGPTLEKLAGHALYPSVVVALYCGLRRGEQLALVWSDLDLDAKTLKVERALEETKAGVVVKPPKTEAGRRTITLPDIVVDVLREHRRRQLELRMALGAGRMPEDAPVFSRYGEGFQSPEYFTVNWHRLVRRLGLPRVTWHSWRHTHASMLIGAGLDIATIAKRLGHANPAITLGIYAHCFKRDDRAAADAINALVR
jgi:integrase